MRIIIDTDAGLDDAQAILMALCQSHVEVVAITTVHGNTDAPQVALNVLRLLRLVDRLDIPVYTGARRGLVRDMCTYRRYHGEDGFGDVPDDDPVDPEMIQKTHAVQLLLDLANKEDDIKLVCLGPLTNVALALHLDSDFGKKVSCYVMGGNYGGQGNVTNSAEFNFFADPEAAKMVLEELGSSPVLITWDLCLNSPISWKWREELLGRKNPKCDFIRRLEAKTIATYYTAEHLQARYELADQLIMAVLINPAVVKKSKYVRCTVETTGAQTTGHLVVDWRTASDVDDPDKSSVEIVTEVDTEIAMSILEETFSK